MMPNFRAWLKDHKEMRNVDFINFNENEGERKMAASPFVRLEGWCDYHAWYEVVLMQSTGLKDKNGVEIYEGDVVNITQYFGGHPYGETKHIIKRSEYNNNLVADSESGDWRTPEVSMMFRRSDDYEVIGNIYKNPELLEAEE